MSTEILGSVTYSETPTVNGTEVLLNGSNPSANVAFGNVAVTGTVTGTNLSGTNTGDQTITLTGDVTGSGTGSFAASLADVGTAGTYVGVTTDAKGRVTSGTSTVAWSAVTATPTTLAGYGITDGGGGGSGGSVLQALATNVNAATGTASLTLSNTAPTIASGTQIWTQTITPSATTSRIALRGAFIVAHATNARTMIAMVFRGTTCISVITQYCATSNTMNTLPISIVDSPASTAALTYSIRIAASTTGTWYVGQTATPYFAGLLATSDILTQELA
jgi:hypothetical protein